MRKRKKITINRKAKHWKDKYPHVEVTWYDICADSSWQSLDDLKQFELPVCVSKGHLFSQNNGITKLFGDYAEHDDGTIDEVGSTTVIPNGCIVDVKKM